MTSILSTMTLSLDEMTSELGKFKLYLENVERDIVKEVVSKISEATSMSVEELFSIVSKDHPVTKEVYCAARTSSGDCVEKPASGSNFCKKHQLSRQPSVEEEACDLPKSNGEPCNKATRCEDHVETCSAMTKRGSMCTRPRMDGTLCKLHSKSASDGASSSGTKEVPNAKVPCAGKTGKGGPCKFQSAQGSIYCKKHSKSGDPEPSPASDPMSLEPSPVPEPMPTPPAPMPTPPAPKPAPPAPMPAPPAPKPAPPAPKPAPPAPKHVMIAGKCKSKSVNGKPCSLNVVDGGYCKKHGASSSKRTFVELDLEPYLEECGKKTKLSLEDEELISEIDLEEELEDAICSDDEDSPFDTEETPFGKGDEPDEEFEPMSDEEDFGDD